MHNTGEAGNGAGTQAPPDSDEGDRLAGLAKGAQFAVIHDEPYITIIYENGMFWGTVVDGTLDRLERAIAVAERYKLKIDRIRCNGPDFDLYLTEVNDDSD